MSVPYTMFAPYHWSGLFTICILRYTEGLLYECAFVCVCVCVCVCVRVRVRVRVYIRTYMHSARVNCKIVNSVLLLLWVHLCMVEVHMCS